MNAPRSALRRRIETPGRRTPPALRVAASLASWADVLGRMREPAYTGLHRRMGAL